MVILFAGLFIVRYLYYFQVSLVVVHVGALWPTGLHSLMSHSFIKISTF